MVSVMAERDKASDLDNVSRAIFKVLKDSEDVQLEVLVETLAPKLGVKDYEIARSINRLRELKLVEIIDPDSPVNLLRYLLSSRSTRFWLRTLTVAVTLLAVYLSSIVPAFITLRYVMSSLLILYLPGASLMELLYPRRDDLSSLERLVLSFGLSLVLVSLLGLLLNYTPLGIRLDPIIVSLTILTLGLSLGAEGRKYSALSAKK